jgi:hypothetical protein
LLSRTNFCWRKFDLDIGRNTWLSLNLSDENEC